MRASCPCTRSSAARRPRRRRGRGWRRMSRRRPPCGCRSAGSCWRSGSSVRGSRTADQQGRCGRRRRRTKKAAPVGTRSWRACRRRAIACGRRGAGRRPRPRSDAGRAAPRGPSSGGAASASASLGVATATARRSLCS
uniref:Uncharacterized protein n=1 Tax=Arundo donax TaxID=35708 RepID=A0A0A9DFT8_ARUDO